MKNTLSMALLVMLLCGTTRASTLYSESSSGDLSNSQAAPTLVTATLGANDVSGTVTGGSDSQDWIAITIPTGDRLDSLFLTTYTSTDAQGFMGVQTGSAFVGSTTNPASYLGYVHYGTGATNGSVPATNLVGQDLLPLMGNTTLAAGSAGFTPPLPANTYTFLIQQLGAATTYTFTFNVSAAAVPEPSSLALLASGALLLLACRRTSLSPVRAAI